jgi:hypothetical protein
MPLRYNPLQVFRASKTPPALYARHKWLGEGASRRWRADCQETLANILRGRSPNGSWGFSATHTVQGLFALHLVVREADGEIHKGLDWLLLRVGQSLQLKKFTQHHCKGEELRGLPFIQSRYDCFLTAATLFLASVFGRADDPVVHSHYRRIAAEQPPSTAAGHDWACLSNLFRALVVHPAYRQAPLAQHTVAALARIQEPSGEWTLPLPFFQTLNALAHLDDPAAELQLEKAFAWLQEKQHDDGAWGTGEQEWNAFLAVHALKRRGLI